MTLLIGENSKTFIGSGTVGPFTWTFRFFDNDDISATIINDSTGEETLLVETSDYALTGAGSYFGGSITLSVALAVGETLYVERTTPPLQEVDLRNQGDFFPETYEEALDIIVASLQDIKRGADLGLKFNGIDSAADTTLPPLLAGMAFIINSAGDGIDLYDVAAVFAAVNAILDTAVKTTAANVNLPTPEAGKFFRWNDAGDGFINTTGTLDYARLSSIEESTLIDGQTSVVFANDVTLGAFFIVGQDADNGRLLSGTDYTVSAPTKTITLSQSYPAGTKVVMAFLDQITATETYVIKHGTLADLQASIAAPGYVAITTGRLTAGDGGGGKFRWDATDHSTATGTGLVDADPQSGVYVPPSTDLTGASGAWVRLATNTASTTEYASFSANIAGVLSLAHAGGSVATASTTAPIEANTLYRVQLSVTTTAAGRVKLLADGVDAIFGDQPNGLWFSDSTVLLDGAENNRIMDATTYTFGLYTSATAYANFSVETDTLWAGTMDLLGIQKVTEKPSGFKIYDSDGLVEDYYFGLKGGGRNRNDIAFGDKSALGLKNDDGNALPGAHNLAIGARALMANQYGDQNTAIGTFSLQSNEGSNNTAMGYSSLKLNNKGQENTSVGYKSGATNTTGYKNTFLGFWAGVGVITGRENVEIGWKSNQEPGDRSFVTYVGSQAGSGITSGDSNTLLGALAGRNSIGSHTLTLSRLVGVGAETKPWGDGAVAVGYQAKVGTESVFAADAVAVGRGANAVLTLAVAVGNLALASGQASIAIGEGSAASAIDVIAIGPDSVSSLDQSIALGKSATATGSRAIAIGGGSSCVGSQSTAVGSLSTPAGANTVAVGFRALNNMTGAANTAIGHTAGLQDVNAYTNCTLLGSLTAVTASNQVQLGDSATTTYAYGPVQDRSDARDKVDIKGLTDAHIAFFMDVEWVQFRLDYREDYNWGEKDGSKERTRFHVGAIAQQVEVAMQKHGIDFAGLQHHSVNGGMDVYTIGYQEFIGIQGEIIQRQQKRLDTIEDRLLALESK